jgi:hypothetical protein
MVFEAMTAHNGREWVVRGAMLIAAAVQVAPIVGALGGRRLRALYGVTVSDPTVELLLRHRAVLLALVGVVIAIGALRPQHRALALAVGLAAKLAFLALSSRSIGLTTECVRVARADIVSSTLLLVAAAVTLAQRETAT